MNDQESLQILEKTVVSLLASKDIKGFRWADKNEFIDEQFFVTCLVIDCDASFYYWELDGEDEIFCAIEHLGYFPEPLDNTYIGSYSSKEAKSTTPTPAHWPCANRSRPLE